ncbi:hypothetical protein SETIT_3G247800v2 [Setaria italica]|uniref:Uncharacterized protein n=1 Tax=Setaria italica TaxID=4555 RepID=A0A368QJ79_SETIT|nr:hypothetical protein SETIT_3G247800v2 [Setaria italica]
MGRDGGAGKAIWAHAEAREEEDGGGRRVANRSGPPVSERRRVEWVWAVGGLRDCGLDGEKEGFRRKGFWKRKGFSFWDEFGIGNFCITILVQHTNMQERCSYRDVAYFFAFSIKSSNF